MNISSMVKGAGAAAAAMLVAGTAAADVVVVRASGPSAATYRAGSALADNAQVSLRQGDMLVVIGPGGTRTLRGPGSFSLASSARSGSALPAAAARRGRFSALRTAGLVPRSPTLWHIDASQSGRFCLADASGAMLWRPDAEQAQTLSIARAGGGTQEVQWPAGAATLAWPSQLPISAGAEYRLSWPGAPEPTRITFATLEREPSDLTQVAQALIGQGCENQLDLLIESAPSQDE